MADPHPPSAFLPTPFSPSTNVVSQAWEKKKGTTKEAAMAAYIALVATLS